MKKYILFFCIIFLISCSSSDSDNNSNSSLHPPSWIQGTWAQVITDPIIIIPFCKFTSNDFCLIASNLETCIRQPLENASQSGANVNVDETISDTEYKFSYSIEGQTYYYHFIKISDTKIEFVNPNQGLPNVPLFKQ
jgi:YHS domain-containing protein